MKNVMRTAHQKVRALIEAGDSRTYKELLSVSLKAVNMQDRDCDVYDINFLKENWKPDQVRLQVSSLAKGKTFKVQLHTWNLKIFVYQLAA